MIASIMKLNDVRDVYGVRETYCAMTGHVFPCFDIFTKLFSSNFISFLGKTKIACAKCQKKCSGEVLRVSEKYFHKSCFQCKKCNKSLATGGFFSKDGAYYCTSDYQKLYGTKCCACNDYVEGEVVQTMGKTYHQKCFTCNRCNQPFQSGAKVTI